MLWQRVRGKEFVFAGAAAVHSKSTVAAVYLQLACGLANINISSLKGTSP